jgi:hypothetical protein
MNEILKLSWVTSYDMPKFGFHMLYYVYDYMDVLERVVSKLFSYAYNILSYYSNKLSFFFSKYFSTDKQMSHIIKMTGFYVHIYFHNALVVKYDDRFSG